MEGMYGVLGSVREWPQEGVPRSLLARDVRGGGRVAHVIVRTGGWRGVGCALDERADDGMDVQRPSMGSGGGREKGDKGRVQLEGERRK